MLLICVNFKIFNGISYFYIQQTKRSIEKIEKKSKLKVPQIAERASKKLDCTQTIFEKAPRFHFQMDRYRFIRWEFTESFLLLERAPEASTSIVSLRCSRNASKAFVPIKFFFCPWKIFFLSPWSRFRTKMVGFPHEDSCVKSHVFVEVKG